MNRNLSTPHNRAQFSTVSMAHSCEHWFHGIFRLGLWLLMLTFIPTLSAGEPKSLEEALLNYQWSWSINSRTITFQRDGTLLGLRGPGKWRVLGSHSAELIRGEEVMPVQFDSAFKKYTGETVRGRRLDPIGATNPNGPVAPTGAPGAEDINTSTPPATQSVASALTMSATRSTSQLAQIPPAALSAGAALPPREISPGREGFAGFPWGSSLAEVKRGMESRGGATFGKSRSLAELIFLGGVAEGYAVREWHFEFVAGQLFGGRIEFTGDENQGDTFSKLHQLLKGKYGAGMDNGDHRAVAKPGKVYFKRGVGVVQDKPEKAKAATTADWTLTNDKRQSITVKLRNERNLSLSYRNETLNKQVGAKANPAGL